MEVLMNLIDGVKNLSKRNKLGVKVNYSNKMERRNNSTHERVHKTEIVGTMNQKYYKGEVILQGLHQGRASVKVNEKTALEGILWPSFIVKSEPTHSIEAWLLYKSKAKVNVTGKITRRILRQQPDWGYAATIGCEMQHTVCKWEGGKLHVEFAKNISKAQRVGVGMEGYAGFVSYYIINNPTINLSIRVDSNRVAKMVMDYNKMIGLKCEIDAKDMTGKFEIKLY